MVYKQEIIGKILVQLSLDGWNKDFPEECTIYIAPTNWSNTHNYICLTLRKNLKGAIEFMQDSASMDNHNFRFTYAAWNQFSIYTQMAYSILNSNKTYNDLGI